MKYIMLNLKRFDVQTEYGGVNRLAPIGEWAKTIVDAVAGPLEAWRGKAEFGVFWPEAHLLAAKAALPENSLLAIGCQGVYRDNIAPGGNFGAFTTNRPAAAARNLGCSSAIIGHCEERMSLAGILAEANIQDTAAVNRLLNQEIAAALQSGLDVLYCIGETQNERPHWQDVLAAQLKAGLAGLNTSRIIIGYEPVWAIGPGKTPPDAPAIAEVAAFIKEKTGGMRVIYGGGLKLENAAVLAGIRDIDGGLIALTRFSGDIGFYPKEYLAIIEEYMKHTA